MGRILMVGKSKACVRLGANIRRFMEKNFSNSVITNRTAELLRA